MKKTWAELVDDTIDQIGEVATKDKAIANTIFEITVKELNTRSLAKIATALEKLAGLPYVIEVDEE